MSIKIYTAWKIPVEKIHDFETTVKPQIWENVADRIWEAMFTVEPEETLRKIKEEDQINYFKKHPKWCCDNFVFEITLEELIIPANRKSEKTFEDVNCGYSVRIPENGKFAVLTPYGSNAMFQNISYPDYVDDFKYWNNVDQPDDISDEEWNKRRKFWDEYGFGTQLQIEIFSCFGGFTWHPFELKGEYIRERLKSDDNDLLEKHVEYVKNNL